MNCKMEDINKAIETGVHGLKIGEEGKPYVTFALDARKWPEEKPSCGSYCLVFSDNFYYHLDGFPQEKFYEPIFAYYDGMWYGDWGDWGEDISIDDINWFVELPKFKKIL